MSRLFSTLARKAPQLAKLSTPSLINSPALRCYSTEIRPRVQKPAPDFKGTAVINDAFKDIKLADYKGKYLVLVFYPLDFTFVCPTELVAFDNKIDDFKNLNTEIIGISIDSHFSHLAWMNTKRREGGLGKLRFPLLSDINKKISRDYDILLENEGIALRGLFIIDPNGILRIMAVNDLPIGRSVDETLRTIKALQFVEQHGEVCPADWRPDAKTIKPDPVGAKEYFKSLE